MALVSSNRRDPLIVLGARFVVSRPHPGPLEDTMGRDFLVLLLVPLVGVFAYGNTGRDLSLVRRL